MLVSSPFGTELQAEVEEALISLIKPYPRNTSSARGILDGSSDLEKISKLVKLTFVRYVCDIKNFAYSHSIAFCPQLTITYIRLVSNSVLRSESEESDVQVNDPENEDEDSNYDDNEEEEPIYTRLVQSNMQISPIKINKVSIFESPILVSFYLNDTIYLVLDTRDMASLNLSDKPKPLS